MISISKALSGVAAVFLCVATVMAAPAKNYPLKPVTVIVPYPPGSGSDIVMRLVAAKLSTAMGEQFIVENRSGAAGNIGDAEAARATPDGYTLLATPSSIAISKTLYKNLPYDVEKDFKGVAMLGAVPLILVVNPKVPVKSVAELIALAKSEPGKLTFASTGNGSTPHLIMEMFMMQEHIKMLHVPYRGTPPAMSDVIAGQVNLMFANGLSVWPQVKDGRLNALAITGAERNSSMPDLPTMTQAGVQGFDDAQIWFALLAPTGTPSTIIDRLNKEVNRILQLPDMKETLRLQGATPGSGTPAQVDAYVKAQVEKYGKVIKATGIHVD